MADDKPTENATVQMTPEQVKRLHAELAASNPRFRGAVPAAAKEEVYPAEVYAESEDDFAADDEEPAYEEEPVYEEEPAPPPARAKAVKPVPAPAPKAVKPAPKPAPVKAKSAARPSSDSPAGGGLLIVGGIGAIVAGLSICLPILSAMQGMVGEAWPIIGGNVGMLVGHLLLGLGMFGAVRRTNGVAALVGTLHMLVFAGLAFFTLAALRVVEIDHELVPYMLLGPPILVGTTWLLSGIWAFAASAGAMGVLHGIFALLGGAALIATAVGGLSGAFDGQRDLAEVLVFAGPGCILLGAIFLAIAMFGRLRQPA